MPDHRASLGLRGEDLACEEWCRRGYIIVERRYRTRAGEIDIIARDGPVTVFVEVRARAAGSFGTPLDSITWQKRHRLCALATQYLFARWLLLPAASTLSPSRSARAARR